MKKTTEEAKNSRLGLNLFFIYTAFYLGFVLVNAFAAEWADWVPLAGLNLAIWWGFSLILLAFVLAMFYGLSCKSDPPSESLQSPGKDS